MFDLEDVGSLDSFARAVALRNPHVWMAPLTPEQAKAFHEELGPEYKKRSVLVTEKGQDVGYIRVVEAFWTSSPEVRAGAVCYPLTPDGTARVDALIALMEDLTLETEGRVLSLWAHSDRPELVAVLKARGYAPGLTNPVTATDLEHFDPRPYAGTIEAAKAAGYEFVSLADLRERRPDSALREYYDFDMAVMEDVPMPDPFQPVPFALFERELFSPGFDFSLIFLALHEGTIAACSGLFKNLADPKIGNTGITGTRREHRRKGLATALKAIAMQTAKERGIERLFTDNEERNPMLQLNLALGFREVMRSTEYRKSLD